jgi:5-hydroxyisourate hydrolase
MTDGAAAMPLTHGAAAHWLDMRGRDRMVSRASGRRTPWAPEELDLAGLTTHVLDVTRGRPAQGVRVELYELSGEDGRTLVADVLTNADGRTDRPLISADEARAGRFELVFQAGDYFRKLGQETADPPFLDVIPIRFAVADPKAHYHVPLIVSPWSYSTYRGS